MSGKMTKEEQMDIAAELEVLLLLSYKKVLASDNCTAADRKALQDLLKSNGWNLDPRKVKETLGSILDGVNPDDVGGEDPDVGAH